MSAQSLKKFINKYQEISDDPPLGLRHTQEDLAWKQGADDLMNALRMNIKDFKKLNELNN